MPRSFKEVALVLYAGLLFGAAANSSSSSMQQVQSYDLPEYRRDVARMLRYVRPALNTPTGVRLSYTATCAAGINIPPIPPVGLQQVTSSNTTLIAVRGVFRSDHNVIVSPGSDGVIAIKIGDVPEALLRTRIVALRLQPIEQYNPSAAIAALKATPEMESAINAMGVRSSSVFHIRLLRSPESGGVHLPAVMNNVTVEQVLDLVAQRFKGLVTYGICTKGRPWPRFFIDFVDLT